MKIIYQPFESSKNQYCNIIQRILKDTGSEILEMRMANISYLRSADAAFLNWYETIEEKSIIKSFIEFIYKCFFLFFFRINKIDIIYTLHNKVSHDVKHRRMTAILMKLILKMSTKIIILSQDSEKVFRELYNDKATDKLVYIPHPNYIGCYKKAEKTRTPSDTFRVLFVGQIRPYKNVELILDIARSKKDCKIEFVIAGAPKDSEYKEKIESMASQCSNVVTKLHFISDEDMCELIENSDILLLPYDLKSSLNSGTVLLAFSNARTVICPLIATLGDYDSDLFYSYEYANEIEHKQELEKALNAAYKDWETDKVQFNKKGEDLYRIVSTFNSYETISVKYSELLKEI